MNRIPASTVNTAVVTLALIVGAATSGAQQVTESARPAPPMRESELDRHLDELTGKLDTMRQQLIESQNEMDELRSEIRTLREQLSAKEQNREAAQDADALRTGVAQLQDETEILEAQVKQHDQSKVETLSKYPLRINGTILFTSILNSGRTDNINLPAIALPPQPDPDALSGSLSATANQTMLGLDVTGPHLWGAHSWGDLNVDFWGGGSSANYTATAGTVRIRTMHARVEWPSRAIAVALDRPLMSPWQPTSWVTTAQPALAWSGNLWTWSPQVSFRQNDLVFRHMSMEGGLIFPSSPYAWISGQSPGPNAAERSRQPGYQARLGTALSWKDHPFNLGASGYYSRQAYNYDHHVDAWAGAGDWSLVFGRAFQWSGGIYRGRGIGGLGGGAYKDYVSTAATDSLHGMDAAGGWTQAKFTISSTLEANVSTGLDNAFAHELRGSDQSFSLSYYANLARNQTVIANLIYRPRSYLLLSTEFRQIDSRPVDGYASQDRIFGVATGYIF
jgi:hypothetical protein